MEIKFELCVCQECFFVGTNCEAKQKSFSANTKAE